MNAKTNLRQPRMPKTKIALIGAAVAALVTVVAFYRMRKVDPVPVRIVQPAFGDIESTVSTDGTVIPTNEFQARANFPGIVEKIFVDLGEKVRPGQLLVTMKDPFSRSRVATARAQLEGARLGQENIEKGGSQEERIALSGDLRQAQLAHDQAVKNLASLKKLAGSGAASPAEVNSAQERVEATEATLETLTSRSRSRFSSSEKTNAAVHVADAQAAMDAAKIQYDNANIASTIGGIAYSIKVRDYDFVPMGADLVRVADLNRVQIRAYFDEPEIGKLIAGQSVVITWDGRPGRTWHGHIKRAPVAATVMGPRSVGECTITVDDSRSELLPNTNVLVRVLLDRHAHVLTLPRAALRTEGSSTFVYKVIDDHLVRTPVHVGLMNLDRFEVVSGVSQNDVIAWRAVEAKELTQGLLVRTAE